MFVEPRGLEWVEEGVHGSGWQGGVLGADWKGRGFQR